MLLALTHGEGWQQRAHDYLQSHVRDEALTGALTAAKVGRFSPALGELSLFDRRADGVAMTNGALGPGRVYVDDGHDPESVAELEIREDGGLRVFLGRLSDQVDARPGVQLLFESAVVLYVRQFLSLVVGAADQAGYLGSWAVAVGTTGLGGCRSYTLHNSGWSTRREPPYSGVVYRRGVITSRSDLTSRAGTRQRPTRRTAAARIRGVAALRASAPRRVVEGSYSSRNSVSSRQLVERWTATSSSANTAGGHTSS
ncbi:MAG: hypothetical protein ACR2JK_02725 [Geodermatophilaceae bacterium]